MRQQTVTELSNRFAQVVQKGTYGAFRRMQQNNRVEESSIFMNKHASKICYVPGKPITKEDAATGDI